LNNIDQLQQSESCIRMSDVRIWVRRIWPRIFLEWHKSISTHTYTHAYIYTWHKSISIWVRLVSFQNDL